LKLEARYLSPQKRMARAYMATAWTVLFLKEVNILIRK
jgi:hypothetical protein